MDVSDGEQHTQEEPSVTTGKEPKTSKTGNLVLSGPNKNIIARVKDSPFRKLQQLVLMQNSVLKGTPKPNRHHVGNITCHLMIPRWSKYTILTTHLYTCVITINISFLNIYFYKIHWILIY